MILINNVKYACAACIKGHRSSQCSHTDRRLSAIRKKGRPVSQCERCREQRKKYRIHQKCTCPKIIPVLVKSSPSSSSLSSSSSSSYQKEITKLSIMDIDSILV